MIKSKDYRLKYGINRVKREKRITGRTVCLVKEIRICCPILTPPPTTVHPWVAQRIENYWK